MLPVVAEKFIGTCQVRAHDPSVFMERLARIMSGASYKKKITRQPDPSDTSHDHQDEPEWVETQLQVLKLLRELQESIEEDPSLPSSVMRSGRGRSELPFKSVDWQSCLLAPEMMH